MFVFEGVLTYAFILSLLLLSTPVAVLTILWCLKNLGILGDELVTENESEMMREDGEGHYDIDGVSYDGEDVSVVGDGSTPQSREKEYRWASTL